MHNVISIDIGSTYTKGALFSLENGRLRLEKKMCVPTTVSHLADGFFAIHAPLAGNDDIPVYFSSSAKGGLAIVAIGLVPELTLKTASLTALSAGGKITSVYAYKLSNRDLEVLAQNPPDIVFFAGGTDGGNESYVRHNAAMLAKNARLQEKSTIIYAGNAAIADEIEQILENARFDVRVVPNILPEIDRFEPHPARNQIREIFLQKIVQGKGLDQIVSRVGRPPLPTPYAVLELVNAIHKDAPEFGDFLLIDLGGATTDVYSCGCDKNENERVVYRGIREPVVKRTVEGDLGMRVSASAAARSAQEFIGQAIGDHQQESFARFLEQISADTKILPLDEQQDLFDRVLASACIHHAVARHAGTLRRVFSASGEIFIQSGKDLRQVPKLIGSGGYLSAMASFAPLEAMTPKNAMENETIRLIPQKLTYYRDRDYLFPLLGNLVGKYRQHAVKTALETLCA